MRNDNNGGGKETNKKKIHILKWFCLTLLILALIHLTSKCAVRFFNFEIPQQLKTPFERYITTQEHLPDSCADALYILGGSTASTMNHISKAAALYHMHKVGHILLFDSKEKWYYEPELERNITRNEWTIKILKKNGIPQEDIDTVPISEGFFGTLSEAQGISAYMKTKSYKSIILVTSPCHMRRTYKIFEHYCRASDIKLYIAGSDDQFSFREMVIELIKVNVYLALISLPWVG